MQGLMGRRTISKHPPVHVEYMRGLMAGDGCFSLTRGGKDKNAHPLFTLTIERGSELILLTTAHYFQDSEPRIYPGRGSYYYRGERHELWARLLLLSPPGGSPLPKKNFHRLISLAHGGGEEMGEIRK